MLVYWSLFLYFALGALVEHAPGMASAAGDNRTHRQYSGLSKASLRFGLLCTALVIGLRYRVGADWSVYEDIYAAARFQTLDDVLGLRDPGYLLLNIIAQRLGTDLWSVNLVCGAILAWGLMRFVEVQERPWLAALVAIPYLVIVVAMGYTRQGASIGLILMGLASYIRRGSVIRLTLYIALAAAFHATAVMVLPLIAIANERGRVLQLLAAAAITYLLYQLFLASSIDRYMTNYVDARYSSEGAGIRVFMDFVAAGLFLVRSRKLGFSERERRIWRNFSLVTLLLPILLMLVSSSTAVDRMALYIIPLQLAVLSRPRAVFPNDGIGTALIILYVGAVQFTWLNFAHHAPFWVPYHLWPIEG